MASCHSYNFTLLKFPPTDQMEANNCYHKQRDLACSQFLLKLRGCFDYEINSGSFIYLKFTDLTILFQSTIIAIINELLMQ